MESIMESTIAIIKPTINIPTSIKILKTFSKTLTANNNSSNSSSNNNNKEVGIMRIFLDLVLVCPEKKHLVCWDCSR